MSADGDVETFWEWFVDSSERIATDPTDDAVIEELDRRVSELGCAAWEIGPGDPAGWFLALSPDGDAGQLERTRGIVNRAPSLAGWTFLPSRPRKQWELQFEIEGASGPIVVDAREWRVVVYPYPDGNYDLVVCVEGSSLAPSQQGLAARIAVEGQLGEAVLMTRVKEVEAVERLSEAEMARSRPLRSLVSLDGPPR